MIGFSLLAVSNQAKCATLWEPFSSTTFGATPRDSNRRCLWLSDRRLTLAGIRTGVGNDKYARSDESAIGGLLLVAHIEGDNHANDIVV